MKFNNNIMKIPDEIKSRLLNITLYKISFDPLFDFFNNSGYFKIHKINNSLEINKQKIQFNVDAEEDDKNKSLEYIASDMSFIVKISAYDLRIILIAIEGGAVFNGYSLEKTTNCAESLPEYKIVAAK